MKTVAELVDELFWTHRRPDGREYTYDEVSTALGGKIDPGYLSKLRRGKIKNPGREALLALCRFFKVRPDYFFPEIVAPYDEQQPEDPMQVALRSTKLRPAVRKKIEELLQALHEDSDDLDQEDGNDVRSRES